MRNNFSYRSPKNGAVCSCCNTGIKRNTEYAIGFAGHRSKQGTIYICPECVMEMHRTLINVKEEKELAEAKSFLANCDLDKILEGVSLVGE